MEQSKEADTVVSEAVQQYRSTMSDTVPREDHNAMVMQMQERIKHLETLLAQAQLAKRGALRRAEAAEKLAMEIHRIHNMPMPADTTDG